MLAEQLRKISSSVDESAIFHEICEKARKRASKGHRDSSRKFIPEEMILDEICCSVPQRLRKDQTKLVKLWDKLESEGFNVSVYLEDSGMS